MNGFALKFGRVPRIESLVKAFCLIVLSAVSAHAATYTVKAGGGGNFTTIQSCVNAMSAGDTCTVYAGTYAEHPTISSGAAGNYKTVTVNSGDAVYVQGFTVSSHDKVNGFQIQDPSAPTSYDCIDIASSSTDSYITNNTMYACGGVRFAQSTPHITNIYFTGNTISYPGCTSSAPNTMEAISVHCDGCLFENNDISHTADGFTEIDGVNNVIRKNTFHDNLQSECGSNSSNCHIDFVASEPNVGGGGYPTAHNLIEGNSDNNCNDSAGCHEWLMQADVCSGQCSDTIMRFNNAAHISTAGLQNDSGWAGIYNYNNTEVDVAVGFGGTGGGGIADSCSNGASDCQYFNNLFYYIGTITDFNAIGVSGGTLTAASHNLAYCTTNCSGLHGTTYGSGTWTGSGQILANPLLASPSTSGTSLGNNTLQAGSPALNGGTSLTTVKAGASNSTTLVVADSGFFQANAAVIPGVNADCIAVGTASNHACISSINYGTNTLTLTSPISASSGDPVWLYSDSTGRTVLVGSAPNIGAYVPSSQTQLPAAPTGLSGSVH